MAELAFELAFRRWVEAGGMGWERLSYSGSHASGETTAYRLSPARPPRALVLAVHGAGNDALFGWIGLFKRLLLRGYEIFTFDLEGHGRFSTTRFAPETAPLAVAEAARRSGADERDLPIHAVGISLGGSILLGALPSLPRIASASLLVAPLRIEFSWPAVRGELRPALLRTLWREREHYGLTGLIPSFGPVKRGTYPLRLAVQPGRGGFGYVEVLNTALEGMRLEEAARRVRVPVLLAYGAGDRLVPVTQGERLACLLPRVELLTVEGGTHLTTPMAPEVVERVVEWMEEWSARPHASPGEGELEEAPPLRGRGWGGETDDR